jgi:hypothetical protein
VDLISVGRLTHSARALDISFKIQTVWKFEEAFYMKRGYIFDEKFNQ